MYSKMIESLLRKNGIKVGDEIEIRKGKKAFKGILLQQTAMGDPDTLVIKLGSGYNMGIMYGKGCSLKLVSKGKADLGRVSKNLLKMKFNKNKPPISVISVGGTVASRVDYKTGGVYAIEDPREFLHNVPELVKIVNVRKFSMPFTIMSEDMDYRDWQEIAKIAVKELNSNSKGVIITHGTDTLHYTSAALSFFIRNLSKPVVVMGSQRSSDRGSSDAGFNLICSSHAAISDIAEVGICMHGTPGDRYCLFTRGTKARKMHTSRRDAFRPINELPLAEVYPDGKIVRINKYQKTRTDEKVELDSKFEPRVALVKVHPGSDPGVLDYYLDKKYKGLVIEATGLGHVPTDMARHPWTTKIKELVKDGLPVVVTSQTLYGKVNPNVYTNLRKLYHDAGAVPGEDMLPETAFVKLGWVLAKTKSFEEVSTMMRTNVAGEISKKQDPKSFLY